MSFKTTHNLKFFHSIPFVSHYGRNTDSRIARHAPSSSYNIYNQCRIWRNGGNLLETPPYMCIYRYRYTHIYTHTDIYTHMYMCVCVHAYIHFFNRKQTRTTTPPPPPWLAQLQKHTGDQQLESGPPSTGLTHTQKKEFTNQKKKK